MPYNQLTSMMVMIAGATMTVFVISAINPSIANSQQYGNQNRYEQPCNR